MRNESKKAAARERACLAFRKQLIESVGHCEICPYVPGKQWRWPPGLVCHEIARGACRQNALDKRFAILVLCSACHEDIHGGPGWWPETRQLAILKESRPEHFDLFRYNLLKNPNAPNRITQDEVNEWKT